MSKPVNVDTLLKHYTALNIPCTDRCKWRSITFKAQLSNADIGVQAEGGSVVCLALQRSGKSTATRTGSQGSLAEACKSIRLGSIYDQCNSTIGFDLVEVLDACPNQASQPVDENASFCLALYLVLSFARSFF
jgi:hypothetical protein